MKIIETLAKSIITKSKLPDADYVVNPYIGCSFACAYCYASFMGRFVGESIESWGKYVYVKTNAVELFKTEISAIKPSNRQSTILLSSVTDAWQGPEKKYRLARGILRTLADGHYPGKISILTKSPLVIDDLGSISQLLAPDVGVTITTTSDLVSRVFEMQAPVASTRLRILEKFNHANIPTYAFLGPLFPHFRFHPEKLEALFRSIQNSGTRELYIEHINLSPYIRKRLDSAMRQVDPLLAGAYATAGEEEHRAALDLIVADLVEKFGFRLRLARVLDHKKDRGAAKEASADQC